MLKLFSKTRSADAAGETDCRSHKFEIEVGDHEKHLVQGSVFSSGIVLRVDGQPSACFQTVLESGRTRDEAYEGDIGTQERLLVRVEKDAGSPNVRVMVNGRLVKVFRVRIRQTARDLVFQTVFPGVFLFLVAYYVFVYRPDVAEFYCGRLFQQESAHPVPASGKPHVFPTQPNRHGGQV